MNKEMTGKRRGSNRAVIIESSPPAHGQSTNNRDISRMLQCVESLSETIDAGEKKLKHGLRILPTTHTRDRKVMRYPEESEEQVIDRLLRELGIWLPKVELVKEDPPEPAPPESETDEMTLPEWLSEPRSARFS